MLPICVQTIFVSDLNRAIRFYGDGLGYEVKATYGQCIAQLKTGSTTLILEQIEGLHPEVPTTVLSFQTTDIRASMRSVVDAGGELVDLEPQRCPVGFVVKFRDPSGVLHDLLQFDVV
jgi:predicted enzyme related to lactoylglutathione lyase